ncbi:MAG: hypothetical protein KF796_19530 [Ramlibacter sp.]|nr:hypothetical protein [Ramlibacter sp.]
MKLFNSVRAAASRARGGTHRLFQVVLLGGPVGVIYAAKLWWLRRRAAQISLYIHREHELHRASLASLNRELNAVIGAQQSTNVAAAQFWRWCDRQAVKS